MKVTCPSCGQIGVLEVRGQSQRVVHYEYVGGKRVFVKHRVVMGTVDGNMGTQMGTEKSNTAFFNGINGGRSLAWLGHRPPTPTTRVQIPAAASKLLDRSIFGPELENHLSSSLFLLVAKKGENENVARPLHDDGFEN